MSTTSIGLCIQDHVSFILLQVACYIKGILCATHSLDLMKPLPLTIGYQYTSAEVHHQNTQNMSGVYRMRPNLRFYLNLKTSTANTEYLADTIKVMSNVKALIQQPFH